MTDPVASPFKLLLNTAVNWAGDIVWLFPHQVKDHHEPVPEIPSLSAATEARTEPSNDWPGSDASGDGAPQPTEETPMTPEQIADIKEWLKPLRDFAIHKLGELKSVAPPAPTTRSILAQQAAASAAATEPTVVPPPMAGPQTDLLGMAGPYEAVLRTGMGGEPRWDVVDARGVSTGYINNLEDTEEGAKAFADQMNAPPQSLPADRPSEPPEHIPGDA